MGAEDMLREISREIDYITEGLALLQHLGEGEKYAGLRESLSKKYANPFRKGLRKFEVLERVELAAEKIFLKDMEEIAYYFHTGEEGEVSCPGKIALLWNEPGDVKLKDVSDLSAYLSGLSEQGYCERFGNCLQNYDDILQDSEETKKMEEPFSVISYLMKMELTEEQKWKLQKIFFEREDHQKRVLALLEKAIAVIKNFEEEMKALAEQFYVYWTAVLEEKSMLEFIREKLEISWRDENPLGDIVRPYFFRPNVVTMYAHAGERGTYQSPTLFRVGILFDEDFDMHTSLSNEESGFEDYVLQVLKLLSDKSKFEILSYIRDKRAYGSELAKHLKLTTATVSHHMNALLAAGLVELEKVDNRVYYRANKKALAEVLNYGKTILTGEADNKTGTIPYLHGNKN